MPPYSTYLGAFSAFAVAALGDSRSSWTLGHSIKVNWQSNSQHLSIVQANKTLLATVPGQNFLSASAGKDQWVGANGNFNYTNVGLNRCQGQNVTGIAHSPRDDSILGEDVSIRGYLQRCGDQSIGYTMSFWVPKDLPDRVAFDINVEPGYRHAAPMTKLYVTFSSDASEDFYGLGAQASFASMKNQTIPIFSREQGVGRGDQPITALEDSQSWFSGGNKFTTYTAIPQYISSASRVFHLREEDTAFTEFDFTKPDAVTVRYDALVVGGHIMQADNMLNAITMLTDYVGKMPTLPEWVDHGAILGIQGGQEKVERIVKQGLKQDCPVAAVWLQDWSGTHTQEAPYGNMEISRLWWNWESDSKLYPTWNEFVQDLREEYGVKTLAYINPFIANVSSKADGYRRNLFLEASKGGYMVQNSTTNSTSIISSGKGIQAGILDLTNQKTRSWFADVLRKQVWNANISGVMWDFGEYTPITLDTKLANISSDAYFYHNQYPRDWAIFQRSVAKEMPLFDEMVTFHRSASLGSNRHLNLFWVGDQTTVWGVNDGIKSAVTIMGQMGMSGYAQSHSDLGGYTTAFHPPTAVNSSGAIGRSAEILGRWGELAAVSSAVFRSHEGNVPEVNAQFYTNSSTYSYYAYNARMFKSLGPYRRRILDTESRTRGWPLLRMPVLYHPDDFQARQISYQSFYLGADLYVAPVLDPQTTKLNVYLPGTDRNRTYTHVWSGTTYHAGQTVRVDAPYGKPAVFVVNRAHSPELDVFLNFVRKENGTVIRV
ncbi:glycosyl hydrolases family 31-domain-containing protein [Aspergillus bertholletiae]|uniref:Glycosyl hydrolases family 31-domain-containing protein n=1 Tax=Aspergillus bertholletiae TaxID=1226010 RepID=A0A5N7BI94_9EURO|nr:glycosyl hydrolases family 31-domain-containing protein [Aspergillus bertholletiae]